MTVPGIVLSQPEMATTASSEWPRTKSSIESATTSREMREARIPSVPIEIPSEIAIVLNSIGVPPAARIPSFTFAARRRRWRLQGVTSVQVFATATSGRSMSAPVSPVARSIARAGARAGPFFTTSLNTLSTSLSATKKKKPRDPCGVRGFCSLTFCRLGRPHPAAKDEDVDDDDQEQAQEPGEPADVHRRKERARGTQRAGQHLKANPTDFGGPCQ